MHAGVPESSLAACYQQYMPSSGTDTAPGTEGSALFSISLPRGDGTWQSGVHTASLLPGKEEKSSEFECLSQCPRRRLLALSETDCVTSVRLEERRRRQGFFL